MEHIVSFYDSRGICHAGGKTGFDSIELRIIDDDTFSSTSNHCFLVIIYFFFS